MRTRTLPLSLLALCLSASGSFAQGLPDPLIGTTLPSPQTAAATDAWAQQVNPAGIAFVDALQVVGGYQGRYAAENTHFVQGATVFSVVEGFSLGSSLGWRSGGESLLRNTSTIAFRVDRSLALGANLHILRDMTGAATTRFRTDMGTQIRPTSWLAVGMGLENLGANARTGDEKTSLRAGVAFRPLGELLTVGLDTRVIAGDHGLGTTFVSGAQLFPSLSVRAQWKGIALTAGARAADITRGDLLDGITLGVGLEVNTGHLGAALLGSYSTDGALESGALARLSAEEFESVLPRFGRWLTFTLTGPAIPEHHADNLVEELFTSPTHPMVVLAGLRRASEDRAVKGVILRLKGVGIGWGRATELRDILGAMSAQGKKVVIHLDSGDDADAYLASVADKLYLTPSGSLDVNGLHFSLTYVAEALDRFGVRAEAVAAGEYKSAPRTFTADAPNPEEIEVQTALLDEIYEILVDGIMTGRDLSREEVEAIIAHGGMSADEALARKMVDGLCYWEEVTDRLEEDLGYKPHPTASYFDRMTRHEGWKPLPRIAVISIGGTIQMGRTGGGIFDVFGDGAGADDIIDAIEQAREDSHVKAVVVRIDSPGGDALASDLIWHALMKLREDKPVIASMGDVAASGGYYVAAAAHQIFAEPSTITGSIGVFSLFFQAEQLAADLGISNYEFDRGQISEPSALRGLNAEERARMQRQVDWVYERFLTAIKEGRAMEDEPLREAAHGRVWTGTQALDRGLIDGLGGLGEALAMARERAGLSAREAAEVVVLAGRSDTFGRLRSAVLTLAGGRAGPERIQEVVSAVLGGHPVTFPLEHANRPLALSPATIRIE